MIPQHVKESRDDSCNSLHVLPYSIKSDCFNLLIITQVFLQCNLIERQKNPHQDSRVIHQRSCRKNDSGNNNWLFRSFLFVFLELHSVNNVQTKQLISDQVVLHPENESCWKTVSSCWSGWYFLAELPPHFGSFFMLIGATHTFWCACCRRRAAHVMQLSQVPQ